MFSNLKFIYNQTRHYHLWYTAGTVFLWLTMWVAVTIPEYLRKSIDLIIKGIQTNPAAFYESVMYIIGLSIVLIFVRTLSRILFFVPARRIEQRLKGELFTKLASFGKDYYDANETGTIISRVNNDINGVRIIAGFGLMQTVNIIFALSLTPYKMYQLSPELTLYCTIPIVLIFIIVRIGMVIMIKNTDLRMKSLQGLSGKIVSYLNGLSIIKAYSIYPWVEKKFEKDNNAILNQTLKIAFVRSFILPLLDDLEQVLKIVILFTGGIYAIKGYFTIGQLTAFISYSVLLTMPVMGFGWVLSIFQQGIVGIKSLKTILNQKGIDDERMVKNKGRDLNLFEKEIEFKNLSFKYSNSEVYALKNISMSIKPGQIIGLAGKVGSGKTTLINCLNGYLNVEPNHLFFDGIDANELRRDQIRSVVRTAMQDVFLFSDSVENNIRFGAGDKETPMSIDEIIYMSALSVDIERFPIKEQTMVGEKGIMLSGGQKQRINLARALFTPSKLLILDDVFSAVDADTERFLIKQIVEKSNAQTILIISNRISVLEKVDIIYLLEDGEIHAKGTHDELVSNSDFYRAINDLQKNDH